MESLLKQLGKGMENDGMPVFRYRFCTTEGRKKQSLAGVFFCFLNMRSVAANVRTTRIHVGVVPSGGGVSFIFTLRD